MKQTAVEFLEQQIRYYISNDDILYDMFKQAKEMEKEQIMQSLNDGKAMALGNKENESLEQYYNETYESNTRI